MSGISWSFTFVEPQAVAERVALQFQQTKDFEFIGDHYVEGYTLQTSSRNNWLEHFLAKIINAYEVNGLDHFALRVAPRQFNGITIEVLSDERKTCVLSNDQLSAAIEGLELLMERIQQRPGLFESTVPNDGSGLAELSFSPASVKEAVQRYEKCGRVNEGDDHPTLIAFMKAHLAIYRDAMKRGLSVAYCVHLY